MLCLKYGFFRVIDSILIAVIVIIVGKSVEFNRQIFSILFDIVLFCKFHHMAFDIIDHFFCSIADRLQRSLEFRCFLAFAPSCNISEAVIRGVYPEVLTYRVGDRLRLNFLAVLSKVVFHRMQLLMRHLMNGSLDCLQLAHSFLDGDPFVCLVIIPLCSALDVFKLHRNGAGKLQSLKELLISLNISGQFIDTDGRQFLAVCLRDIKYTDYFVGRSCNFLLLFNGIAVFIQDRQSCIRINLVHLHHFLVGSRSQDLDSFFTFLHLSAELFLPCGISGNESRFRFLHGDQHRIVQ